MRKILITDSYFFQCGVRDIITESHLIGCYIELKNLNLHGLTSRDCIIIYISSTNILSEIYHELKTKTRARIIVAVDYDLARPLVLVNNTFFLSSNADTTVLLKVINNIKDIKFKRKLTNQEEIVIRLIMDGYDCENISKKMNLSIKTISLHKNKAKMKTGLLKNNDFTSFSLMKILFGSSSGSYVPGHVGYTVSNTALI